MFFMKEQKSKYKILSRIACERYCTQKHSKSSLIISIASTYDNVKPNIWCDDKNNVKYILSLAFDDVEYEDDKEHCIMWEQGKQIADFVNEHYKEVDRIIVHCDGGISRSAGVAAAIMRVKEGDDSCIFDNKAKHPNMTCYLRTLKGFKYI